MTDLRCRSAIHFLFNFSEIKTNKLRESQREKERNTLREGRREHRAASTEHWSRGIAICVLRSPICDEGWSSERRRQRRARYGDDVIVRGLLGLVLVCVLGIFFFFLINTYVLCVWFGFVLGFDLSTSDDTTWWVQFLIICIFFFFFWLRIRGLAVSELPVMGSPWAWLAWAWFCFIYIYIYIYFRF